MADYGTVGLGESLTGAATYHFCYQATAGFDITLNWTAAGTTATVTYQELGGSASSSSTSITAASGSYSFALPASTYCYVYVTVEGGSATTYLT